MTPSKQVENIKIDFLDQINSIFEKDNSIFSIEFEPVENDYNIEPTILTVDGVLTCIDEFGNDYDEKLSQMSIEIIALILTLILTEKYNVYERI